MENVTPMPPAVSAALESIDEFPERLRALRSYAYHLTEGMPQFHQIAVADSYSDAAVFGEGFWYAIGIQVGRALAEGVDIDDATASSMLAEARAAWEADYGVHVSPDVVEVGQRLEEQAHREREANLSRAS